MELIKREIHSETYQAALNAGLNQLQARILASRLQAIEADEIERITNGDLSIIPHPKLLKNAELAAQRIVVAIRHGELIAGVFDFDNDGLTSGAICQKTLEMLGHPETKFARVVGSRFVHGYGLSATLADEILARDERPSLVITADCGSSDEPNIARLKKAGIDVIVTDHHAIPESGVPQSAYTCVNPTQVDCTYPDKTIAGCAVIWLVLALVRSEMTQCTSQEYPSMARFLDYVAQGTVADCVSVQSPVNRVFIRYGLHLINQKSRPCWDVIAHERGINTYTETELAFQVGPLINARSRMDDPQLAARFLITTDIQTAQSAFNAMHQDNTNRKEIQAQMTKIALEQVTSCPNKYTAVAISDDFHEGVQGIVASKLKEEFGRPSVVISKVRDGVYKGSARSIESVDLCGVFNKVNHDNLFTKMGGHKMAHGFELTEDKLTQFKVRFEAEVKAVCTQELVPTLLIDGEISALGSLDNAFNSMMVLGPYGQRFEKPLFAEQVHVEDVKVIGRENPVHLRMTVVVSSGERITGVWFNALKEPNSPLPCHSGMAGVMAFELAQNEFRGQVNLQALIRYFQVKNESYNS